MFKISSVKLVNNVQFFQVSGSQLSVTQGLTFVWDGKSLQVTHPNWPKKRIFILPANIAQIEFTDTEEVEAK